VNMRRAFCKTALRAVAVATLLASAAACASSHRLGAAEPAKAPATSIPPTGLVRQVGPDAEGITYDASTNSLAVAVHSPDRLLILDPRTLGVRSTVALPGSARHLELAGPGGPVLVPLETTGQLGQVSLPTGALDLIDVGKQPHDAAATGDGTIVVGNEFGHSLTLISNGSVRLTVGGVTQPGGVIGDGTQFAVVDVAAFVVDLYDTRTGTKIASAPAGAGPTHGVMANGQRLVVADTRGDAILVFGFDPLRELSRTPLPGNPYGLAFDASTDSVWVTLTARNEVVGLDVASGTPTVVARYPTVRQPNTIAVNSGSTTLWVTGTRDGTVERISR
jgi:DNA-binding beta-propeller fold protein YncE